MNYDDRHIRFESVVDKIIRRAMEEGKFDDLSSEGKPLPSDDNPFENPDMRAANRFLRESGFAPAWIEERKDINARSKAARIVLRRTWNWCEAEGQNDLAKSEWRRVTGDFREHVAELNRRIADFNLKAPMDQFYLALIDSDKEIGRISSQE